MKPAWNEKTARILLILIIAARASSFCFSKICLLQMDPFCLLGLRFTLAFLLLVLIFFRRIKDTFELSDLLKGGLFGILFFMVMVCEYRGLRTTPTSIASFIENLAIVLVPLLQAALLRRLPAQKNLICMILVLFGVGFLTLTKEKTTFSRGELYLLGAAFFYSATILVTGRFSKSGNPLNMGIFQVGTVGILGLLFALQNHRLTFPESPKVRLCICILAVVCTGFGHTLQPLAQSKLPVETAGVFCAVNPLVASMIGVCFLGETPSAYHLLGEVLIILALLLSGTASKKHHLSRRYRTVSDRPRRRRKVSL